MLFYIFFTCLFQSAVAFAMDMPPPTKKVLNFQTKLSDAWRLIDALDFDAHYFPENCRGVFAQMASQQKWGYFYKFFKKLHKAKIILENNHRKGGKISRCLLDNSNKHFPLIIKTVYYLNKSVNSDIKIKSKIFNDMVNDINEAVQNLEEYKFFMLCDGIVQISAFSILLTRKGVFNRVLEWEEFGAILPLSHWVDLPQDPEVIDTLTGNNDLKLIPRVSSEENQKKKGLKKYLWRIRRSQ